MMLLWAVGFAQQRTDSVHVAHYDINLSVLDFTNKVIEGHTDLSVVSKINNLTQVRLDLMVLTVDDDVPADVLKEVTALDGIFGAKMINLNEVFRIIIYDFARYGALSIVQIK